MSLCAGDLPHMIAARWADAEGGGDRMTDHPAHTQSGQEVTVTMASETLNVGERGIYHAKTILEKCGPPPPGDGYGSAADPMTAAGACFRVSHARISETALLSSSSGSHSGKSLNNLTTPERR